MGLFLTSILQDIRTTKKNWLKRYLVFVSLAVVSSKLYSVVGVFRTSHQQQVKHLLIFAFKQTFTFCLLFNEKQCFIKFYQRSFDAIRCLKC